MTKPSRNFLLGLVLLLGTSPVYGEFSALQWLYPSADAFQHLSTSPAECLDLSGSAEQNYRIEVGRQAFRSPALLGGQAARVGLSCQACHLNGRDHPSFYIEGLSGAPGTIDVTTAVFSELRGDSLHNPLPIPDLLDVAQQQNFGTRKPVSSLREFVKLAIVEEFAGEVLEPLLLSSLINYLEALSVSACPSLSVVSNDLQRQLANISRSMEVLRQAYEKGELMLVDFLVMSAQHELSVLYQYYTTDQTVEEAHKIVLMSRELGKLRTLLLTSPAVEFINHYQNWQVNWDDFEIALIAQVDESLYQQENLAAFLVIRQ